MKSRPVSVVVVLLFAFAVSASIAFAGTNSAPTSQLMFEGKKPELSIPNPCSLAFQCDATALTAWALSS
jgi:hypothetical protein